MSAQESHDWGVKPAIRTQPFHHFCEVMERGDIEANLHSSAITVYDAGIKLDGKRNRSRLCEVTAIGPGRWVQGGRQPAEVAVGQLVYVKERTVPLRLHLRKQNHYFIAMDAVMAELDPVNVKLRPVGQYVVTREVDERARVAVMGALPFHLGKTFGIEKKGEEADDIGCNKTRIEEVVAVGPGKFGGYRYTMRAPDLPPFVREATCPRHDTRCTPERCWQETPEGEEHRRALFARLSLPKELVTEPYWETPDCKPGDLIVFTDLARPTEITLAGRKFTLFEFDHSICCVLDQAI